MQIHRIKDRHPSRWSTGCTAKSLALGIGVLLLFVCGDSALAQGRLNQLQETRSISIPPVPQVQRLKENQASIFRYTQTQDPRLERRIEDFLGIKPTPSISGFAPPPPRDPRLETRIGQFLGTSPTPSLSSRAPLPPPKPRKSEPLIKPKVCE
jgi:hypothetical protein